MLTQTLPLTAREQSIFQKLQDEESKALFLSRKRHAMLQLPPKEPLDYTTDFIKRLNQILRDSRFVLYGFGGEGQSLIQYYEKLGGKGLTAVWDRDQNKSGHILTVSITPPPEIGALNLANIDYVIITPASRVKYEAMRQHCLRLGLEPSRLFALRKFPDQYFDPQIVSFQEDEIFIDGGSFDFCDSLDLLHLNPHVKKIYAFEPDRSLCPGIVQAAAQSGFPHVQIESSALWSCRAELRFDSEKGRAASAIEESGAAMIHAVALDQVIAPDERVTFIKLDIEGAEHEALKGAAHIIKRDKPTLAICIYHRPNDYFELPEYIGQLVPEYRFYMRHYHYTAMETVLYCVL